MSKKKQKGQESLQTDNRVAEERYSFLKKKTIKQLIAPSRNRCI